jgi:hypothetical protein
LSAQQTEAEAEEEAEEFPVHGVGIFLGGATETRREENVTYGALGLEYGLQFSRHWEVAAVIEFVGPEEEFDREIVVLIPLVYIYKRLHVVGGPGVEFVKEETEGGSETETEFLGRIGVAYRFPVGKGFALLPQFNTDFIEGGKITYVYGVTVSKEF